MLRRNRLTRTVLESLETRTLLSNSAIDTIYGTGGIADITGQVNGFGGGAGPATVMLSNESTVMALRNVVGEVDSNGFPVLTFGTGGIYTLPNNLNGTITDLAVQDDGKILVSLRRPVRDCIILRLTTTGQLDTTWGTNGVLNFDFVPPNPPGFGQVNSYLDRIRLLPDGSIIAAGRVDDAVDGTLLAVAKVAPDGTLDASFDADGSATYNLPNLTVDEVRALRIQSDGRILLLHEATDQTNFNLVGILSRINADGSLDTTFDADGWLQAPVSGNQDTEVQSIEIDANAGILVSGGFSTFGQLAGFIAHYGPTGVLDTNFGTAGVADAPVDPNGNSAGIYGMALTADGNILAAHDSFFGLYLFSPDGQLDTTFDTANSIPAPPFGSTAASQPFVLNDQRFLASGVISDFGAQQGIAVRYLGDFLPHPVATITAPATASEADAIQLSATARAPVGNTITSYQWDLDYDGFNFVADLTGQDPVIPAYTLPGTADHVIALRVYDNTGDRSSTVTATIHILKTPPVASFTLPATAAEDQAIALTATATTGFGRAIVGYLWDIDYNGTFFVPDVAGQSPTLPAFLFNGPSTHTIALRITESTGDSSAIVTNTIQITNSAPVVSASVATNPAFVDLPVTINLASSDGPGDTVSSWVVDWGDGHVDALPGDATTATRTYSTAGQPTISVTATDNNGATSDPALLYPVINPTPQLAGTVFNDANANGVMDSGESPLPNLLLYLDANNNGLLDVGETATVTDSTGYYFFSGIPTSSGQRVRIQNVSGFRTTTPVGTALPALPEGQTRTLDVGLTSRITVTGQVFLDANKNRRRESSERALAGWRVYVDANRNGRFDRGETAVLTDSRGRYTLSIDDPGSYLIRIMVPARYRIFAPATGTWALKLRSGALVQNRNFAAIFRR